MENHTTSASVAGHLDTPIDEDQCRKLLNFGKRYWKCFRHRRIKTKLEEFKCTRLFSDVYPDYIPAIQNIIDIHEKCFSSVNSLQVGLASWYIQKEWMITPSLRGGTTYIYDVNQSRDKVLKGIKDASNDLQTDYDRMVKAESVKDKICYKNINHGFFNTDCSYIMAERDVSMIKKGGEWFLIPTPQLLSALDLMQTRYSLKQYWVICDVMNKYPGQSMLTLGMKLINYFEKLRAEITNDVYSVLDIWSAYLTGWIINAEDDVGDTNLFETQEEELFQVEQKTKVRIDRSVLLPPDRSENTIMLYLEMLGICKHFGHPTLDPKCLLDPLKKYGVDPNELPATDTLRNVTAIMKREFILNYFKKEKRYPNFSSIPPILQVFIQDNKLISSDHYRNYPLWHSVKFAKTFEYDYTPDMVEILKDSSTGLNRSAWGKNYDKCSYNILYGKPPPPSFYEEPLYKRRTILEYLSSHPDAVREVITERENNIYNIEDKVVFICGKENELKLDSGRGFTVQTSRQRLVQTSNEYNVSKYFFKYIPEQSMTDSEVDSTRRILFQVKNMLKDSEIQVLDLKKWCLFWRWWAVREFGRMLDELFGFNGIFTNAHTHFIFCWIFSNSRMNPPDYDPSGRPIPGDFFMDDFHGGMEGMHQKRWTYITICAIKYAAEQTGISIQILGQGDNQIVIIHFKPGDDRVNLRRVFRDNLIAVIKAIGHNLKEKETWSSVHLHEYGKMRIYRGRYVSQGTKKASKIMPDSNDVLNSIPSCMGTLNTMTEGIARGDYSPDAAYILNNMLMTRFLVRRKILPSNSPATSACLLFPLDFGGLTLSSYHNHAVRGHNDNLTVWLGVLLHCRDHHRDIFSRMVKMWRFTPEEELTDEKFMRFIEDIYCLRIRTLPSVEMIIKERALDFLMNSESVTNPSITMLKDYVVSEEEICKTMRTMQPFFAQIAHHLFEHSNVGLLKKLPARFTSVKTMETIIMNNEPLTLPQKIKEQNNKYLAQLKIRITRNTEDSRIDLIIKEICPTQLARVLRRISWEVDSPALTKPTFQHQFNLIPMDFATDEEAQHCILIKTSPLFQILPRACTERYGPYKPYVGSTTSQKIKKPTIDIAERTGHVKSFLQLGHAKSWAHLISASNLEAFIDELIDEKVRDIRQVQEEENRDEFFKQVLSGNIGHRFLTEIEKPYAMINSLPGFTTHFQQSSNNMSYLSEGGSDYNVFYQYVYISNMFQIYLSGLETGIVHDTYIAVLSCSSCCENLTGLRFDTAPGRSHTITPFPQPDITVSDNRHANYIQNLMEFTIGILLARNIDQNFKIMHNKEGFSDIPEPKKEQISVNDMRMISLSTVLDCAILHSKHCRSLIKGENSYLLALSQDNSFIYFAELLSNSGLFDELIKLLNPLTADHTSLTHFEKMSSMIARLVPSYIRNKGKSAYEHALRFQYVDECLEFTPILWMAVSDIRSSRGKNMMRVIPEHVYESINIPRPTLVNLEMSDVVTIWRRSDRAILKPTIRPHPVMSLHAVFYPYSEVHGYSFKRTTEVGTLRIKELSFLARPLGVISSAINKYLECLVMMEVFLWKDKIKTIMSLAEGSGGTLASLSLLFNCQSIIYNTLISADVDLRDDPTNFDAPAVKFTGQTSKVVTTALSRGTTNILDPRFIQKLKEVLIREKVDLVTMDAENLNHSTNLHFILKIIPILIFNDVKIMIFKMFYESDFEKELESITKSPAYRYSLIKPISSNPIGTEIFLFVFRVDVGVRFSIHDVVSKIWTQSKKYLSHKSEMGLSMDQLKEYMIVTRGMDNLLRKHSQDIITECPDRYIHRVRDKESCGLICKKNISKILDAIDYMHSGKTGILFKIVSRSSGTETAITRLCCDLTYLILYIYGKHTFHKFLTILSQLDITDDLHSFRNRSGPFLRMALIGTGNFINTWGDIRHYMRTIHSHPKCRCEPEIRSLNETEYKTSLAHRLVINLKNLHLIKYDVFASYRITRNECSSEKRKDGVVSLATTTSSDTNRLLSGHEIMTMIKKVREEVKLLNLNE